MTGSGRCCVTSCGSGCVNEPDFHDPARPTRYVTPDEFGVGQNYVAGCPNCERGSVMIEYRVKSWRHPFRGVWVSVEEECRFCRGWGSVLYVRQPDLFTFAPQPR